MRNKTIFIAGALMLLIVSGVAGYFVPGWLAERRMEQRREAFRPGAVPKLRVEAFSRDFHTIDVATEPQNLPDGAFVNVRTGAKQRFTDFEGKPTLVNFWATWCMPCVVELPSLEAFARHYEGRINVIAVALEEGKTSADITAFLEKRGVGDFAGYLDGGDIGRALNLRGLPTSFVLSSNGDILYRMEGDADWTSEESREFFDVLLLHKR